MEVCHCRDLCRGVRGEAFSFKPQTRAQPRLPGVFQLLELTHHILFLQFTFQFDQLSRTQRQLGVQENNSIHLHLSAMRVGLSCFPLAWVHLVEQ